MTVSVELWQLLAGVAGYTSLIIAILAWIDNRFNKLITIVQYDKKIDEIEGHIHAVEKALYKLEIWAAKQNGPREP